MEDHRKKKVDVWRLVAQDIQAVGFCKSIDLESLRKKAEEKWRNLLKSHKDVRDSKKATGSRRKDFRYYKEMEEIVVKRHDINPPVVSGNGCAKLSTIVSTSKPQEATQPDEEVESELDDSIQNISLPSTSQPSTPSARRRRDKRAQKTEDEDKALAFLKELEATRKEEARVREENRNKRAEERNNLFREFLNILKDK